MKMNGLKAQDNILVFIANSIKYGKLDPYEPGMDKWGMYDKDGNIRFYAIDNDYMKVEFDEADIPEDYAEGKYFFINGEFVLNPDWVEPLPPIEDQVRMLAENMAVVARSAEDSEEALCDIDESYNQRIADLEDALCELAEMLSSK